MGFFGKKYNEIEESLLELYTEMFTNMGLPSAKKRATELLDKCIDESKKAGHYESLPNLGDILVDKIAVNKEIDEANEKYRDSLNKIMEEGVTDDDIRWYYNLNDVERRMMFAIDDMNFGALFISKLEEGLPPEDAARFTRKYHPYYGDPDDTKHTSGDDRPLPEELRDRINIYIENRAITDPEEYKRDIENASSFNALIRKEIRKGNI